MMCDWCAKLDRYVDAELPEAELKEMQAHLRTCPTCAADALSRLQLKHSIQVAGKAFVPRPEFRLKIEHTIAPRKQAWWRGWMPQVGVVVAALALLFIAAGLWLQRSSRQQTIGELADIHVSTLASANPVDVVSTDRHTVKPWFAGKLPFTFNLPELQGSRFKLVGGRMAYFEQGPGAQLLFEVGKHHISVFVFENRAELSRLGLGRLTTKNAFNVESWTERDLRFFAVSDAEPAAVHELSELFKSAGGS